METIHRTKSNRSMALPWLGFVAIVVGLLIVPSSRGQEDLPFEAQVATNIAAVHAAPSNKAYATDTLRKGAVVEVYRIDPGGWWAVRPPLGSFSLVASDALEPTEDPMVARVARDGVKVWVGTRVSEKDTPLWQVKLARGELVELLSPRDPNSSRRESEETWILIQPPAGEFRWIHERELRRETAPRTAHVPDAPMQAEPVVHQPTPSGGAPSIASSGVGASDVASAGISPESSTSNGSSADGTAPPSPAALTQATPASANQGSTANPSNQPMSQRTGQWERVETQTATPPSSETSESSPSSPPSTIDSDSPTTASTLDSAPDATATAGSLSLPSGTSFGERLRTVEAWFDSHMIEQPMVAAERLEAALGLLEQEASAGKDRETLRQLRDRYGRWRELDLRRKALERLAAQPRGDLAQAASEGVDGADPAVRTGDWQSDSPGSGEQPASLGGASSPTGGYAAQGTLSRLIRSGGLQPSSYALQDANGKVVALVVPSPGVNLERYLKQEVGVVGTSTSNPTLSMPTVVADRIVELERHR